MDSANNESKLTETSSLNDLYEEADVFDTAAAIGGLKFNKIAFGSKWSPISTFKKNESQVKNEFVLLIRNTINSYPDFDATLRNECPESVAFLSN